MGRTDLGWRGLLRSARAVVRILGKKEAALEVAPELTLQNPPMVLRVVAASARQARLFYSGLRGNGCLTDDGGGALERHTAVSNSERAYATTDL